MTWPPTLYDDTDLYQACKVRPDSPDLPTAQVKAPCCGRTCAADMVVDLRDVPGTVCCPGGNHRPSQDVEWACDACRGRIVRSGRNPWTDSQLARALGATPKVQRAKRAREMLTEYRRQLPAGEGVNPREYREGVLRQMEGQDSVPGTDPPVDG